MIRVLAALVAVTLTVLLAPPAPAHAAGAPFRLHGSTLTDSRPSCTNAGVACTKNNDVFFAASGSFKVNGDLIHVKDVDDDGHSAIIYYENTSTGENGACINTAGHRTIKYCRMDSFIPDKSWVCIYAGWMEMAEGPNKYDYRIAWQSKNCIRS